MKQDYPFTTSTLTQPPPMALHHHKTWHNLNLHSRPPPIRQDRETRFHRQTPWCYNNTCLPVSGIHPLLCSYFHSFLERFPPSLCLTNS